jgi:hypothetical protein
MTPKEKAKELYDKYLDIDGFGYYRDKDSFMYWSTSVIGKQAKQCALIAVDEIINLVKHIDVDSEDYWEEVKQEIEKL